MIVDKVTALLAGLDASELDRLPPARRQRFAELCAHWHKLAERRQDQPKAGILADLKDGRRSE
jgi:hypothetical protein